MSTTPGGVQPTAQEITGAGRPPAPTPLPVPTPPPAQTEESKAQAKEVESLLFNPNAAPTTVPVKVHLPGLLPNCAPFEFIFRIKFSSEMQKKRDAYLNLAPKKQEEAEEGEIFAETCDLLAEDPKGFFGWPDTVAAPGDKLKAYVQGITNAEGLQVVKSILRSANLYYWGKVTPREFFPPSEDSGT
jgi:hypothetical protein